METTGKKHTKTLDTLIPDINKLLTGLAEGKQLKVSEDKLNKFLSNIKDAMIDWSNPVKQDKSHLRMSIVGRPTRQLWYDKNQPKKKAKADPSLQLKFLYGHLLEHLVLFLTDLAGHEVTDQQKKDYEAEGRKPHWRFLLKTERMKWDDLLKGEIDIDLTSLSDPVLFREDGVPLYTFSSAVDDIDYDITNVIRGDDHTSNTAVQVEIINALDQNKITFAHHALLKASSGDKLSKRDNVISISSFREANMEPISILSLLATIGTSNSIELKDNIDQIKSEFKLSTISTSPGRIEIDVLNALNKKQVQKYNFSEIEERLKKIDEKIDQKFWETIRGNLNVVEDIKQWTDIVFNSETIKPSDKDYIKIAMELIPDDPWNDETWGLWTSAIKEKTGRKGKELFLPLREAFTGLNHGPEMKLLIQLLGREKIIERVEL